MAGACKKITQERLLKDVLESVVDSVGGGWKVLILDDLTKRIFSSCLKMSDIVDSKVSTVENLYKQREPLMLAAVYFIEPTVDSIKRMQLDFEKTALYPSVHVFFTSRVPAEALEAIKRRPLLLQRLKTMKEVNLEYLTVDSRTVITAQPNSLIQLMGERCEENRRGYDAELEVIATRLTTLLSTLNEFPNIRFKAGKVPEAGDPPGAQSRYTLCQRIADKVTERVMKLQRANQLPGQETCDLLILDRSFDPVATVIHEWTYEAMVYDLLKMEGNVYQYEAENQAGKQESKESALEESDDIWVSLRHLHIAEVYQTVYKKFQDFQAKYKAIAGRAMGTQNTQVGAIKGMITAMPQYRDVLSRLALHIQISSEIKNATNWRHLTDVGDLEQNLVYGDKNSKDLINFMMAAKNQDLDRLDKIRLFMCYVATHPGKLDSTINSHWQSVANLSAQDMNAVCNLSFLGVNVWRTGQERAGLTFSRHLKGQKGTYKQKEGREELYTLGKFEPLLGDVIEEWTAGKLPAEQYPYVREPQAGYAQQAAGPAVKSARQTRAGINWAKRPGGPEGSTGALGTTGRRMIILVVGGVMRSEMRVAHTLSSRLGRDIILVSTSVETPTSFINVLSRMNSSLADEFVS